MNLVLFILMACLILFIGLDNTAFSDRLVAISRLALATTVFSDLNPSDGSWSQNPMRLYLCRKIFSKFLSHPCSWRTWPNKTILSTKTWPPNSFCWSSSNTSPERLKQAFHGSRISWSERITPNCREISSVKRRRKASEKAKDIRASPTLTSTETFSKLALSVFCLRIQNNKERWECIFLNLHIQSHKLWKILCRNIFFCSLPWYNSALMATGFFSWIGKIIIEGKS